MSHDYSPDWDYITVLPSLEDRAVLERVAATIAQDLAPKIGISSFQIFCVEQGNFGSNVVGRFVSGTSSDPVVGLDLDGLRESCVNYGVDFSQQICATIAHELGHAIEERYSGNNDEHDEEVVEKFAYQFAAQGDVCVELLGLGPDNAASSCEYRIFHPEVDSEDAPNPIKPPRP